MEIIFRFIYRFIIFCRFILMYSSYFLHFWFVLLNTKLNYRSVIFLSCWKFSFIMKCCFQRCHISYHISFLDSNNCLFIHFSFHTSSEKKTNFRAWLQKVSFNNIAIIYINLILCRIFSLYTHV